MKLSTLKLVAIASTFAAASIAQATPILDGNLTAGDGYGAPVATITGSYVNGSDASGGTNDVSLYFTYDATNVYGAVHLDSGAPSPFPGSNIYFYSSGSSTHTSGLLAGTSGTYGDGDDIIAEGSNGWGYATPAGIAGGIHFNYSPSTVQYFYNGSDTVEFIINRSLLGDYNQYRYGGQIFGYEFHTGGDRISGPLVSVPEPTTLAALAGVAGVALRRRRSI